MLLDVGYLIYRGDCMVDIVLSHNLSDCAFNSMWFYICSLYFSKHFYIQKNYNVFFLMSLSLFFLHFMP